MSTSIYRQSTSIRQQQIIEATKNIITTKGMESVTIDAIADEVGLTEGAIYRHFANKHQILTLMIDDIERGLFQTLRDSRMEGSSAVGNMEHILYAHLSDVENHNAASFIVITEAMAFDGIGMSSRVSLMLSRYLEFLTGVLKDGITDGTVRDDLDVEAAATSFLGIIQSTATLWALNGHVTPLAEKRTQMWDMYKRGIVPAK